MTINFLEFFEKIESSNVFLKNFTFSESCLEIPFFLCFCLPPEGQEELNLVLVLLVVGTILPGGSYSHLLCRPGGVPQQTNRASSRVSTQSQIQAKQLPSTSTSSKYSK